MTIYTSRQLQQAAVRVEDSSNDVLKELDDAAARLSFKHEWASIPRRPLLLFGRDNQLGTINNALKMHPSSGAAIAILGTGGVGKTSLALATLHHPDIAELYTNRRLFVSCENASDSKGIISSLAVALQLGGDNLRSQVLHELAEAPALIVLDNLETPWEPSTARSATETLLGAIASLPGVSLIITMRGAERPLGVEWHAPHLPVLLPFDRAAALQTVYSSESTVTDADLGTLDTLLDLLGNLPLAVHIIAAMLQHESVVGLLQRWQVERTSMLSLGGPDKLSSLDVSIAISLNSGRVRGIPGTIGVLVTLSLFPDGVLESETGLHLLSAELPSLRRHVSALKQSSLVYTSSSGRLCMLPPVREFVQKHHSVLPDAIPGLVMFCKQFIEPLEDFDKDIEAVNNVVLPEVQNIQSICEFLFQSSDYLSQAEELLALVPIFNRYIVPRGYSSMSLLVRALALARSRHRTDSEIDILIQLSAASAEATVALMYGKDALKLAEQQPNNCLVLARVLHRLSRCQLSSNDGSDSRESLLRALDVLSQQEPSRPVLKMRADLYASLAHTQHIYFEQSSPGPSGEYMQKAQSIYEELGSLSGVNTCRTFRAMLALTNDNFYRSEQEAQLTLRYAKKTRNVIGEAGALRILATTAMFRGDLRGAVKLMERHADIFQRLASPSAVAWTLKSIAQLELDDDHLDDAEEQIERALASSIKHTETKQTLTRIQCLKARAAIRTKQGDMKGAAEDFEDATQHIRIVAEPGGEEEAELTEQHAKFFLASHDTNSAMICTIAPLLVFQRSHNAVGVLRVLGGLADVFAASGEHRAAWRCWSAALAPLLRNGTAFYAGNFMLGMAKAQSLAKDALMEDVASGPGPDALLRKAFALFETNGCLSGQRRCCEVAAELGVTDPSEPAEIEM